MEHQLILNRIESLGFLFSRSHFHYSDILECFRNLYFTVTELQLYSPSTAKTKEVRSRTKPQWRSPWSLYKSEWELKKYQWISMKKSHFSLVNANHSSSVHTSPPHKKTIGPPNARWKYECHTSNALHRRTWFHSARQSGTAGREKSKQKAGSVLNGPRMLITLVTGKASTN